MYGQNLGIGRVEVTEEARREELPRLENRFNLITAAIGTHAHVYTPYHINTSTSATIVVILLHVTQQLRDDLLDIEALGAVALALGAEDLEALSRVCVDQRSTREPFTHSYRDIERYMCAGRYLGEAPEEQVLHQQLIHVRQQARWRRHRSLVLSPSSTYCFVWIGFRAEDCKCVELRNPPFQPIKTAYIRIYNTFCANQSAGCSFFQNASPQFALLR